MELHKSLKRKAANMHIVSALIWAAVMIACSLVLTGSDYSEKILNVLILGYFTHFLFLTRKKTESQKATSPK